MSCLDFEERFCTLLQLLCLCIAMTSTSLGKGSQHCWSWTR